MAQAYASVIIEQPVAAVWAVVRDFNAMPRWHAAIANSTIENGRRADAIGAIRELKKKV